MLEVFQESPQLGLNDAERRLSPGQLYVPSIVSMHVDIILSYLYTSLYWLDTLYYCPIQHSFSFF